MDLAQTQLEVAQLRERSKSHAKDLADHDKEFAKVWTFMGELEKRIRALEIRVAVIAAVAGFGGAGVGSLVGGLASKFLH